MKTRRDHLVELVTGLLMSPRQGTIRQHVEEAQELLTEIEKVCPNATLVAASAGAEVYTQDSVDALEAKRNNKRRQLFEAQDDVDRKRAELIEEIERQLQTKTSIEPVFTLRWTLRDGAGTTA